MSNSDSYTSIDDHSRQGWTISNIKVSSLVTSGEWMSAPGIVFNNPGFIDLFSYKVYRDPQ